MIQQQPSSRELSKLLLIQNMLAHLPDETQIMAFMCSGLSDLPGVKEADYRREQKLKQLNIETTTPIHHFPIALNGNSYGILIFHLTNPDLFEPYIPYVVNLCFMTSILFEERRQRTLLIQQREELELRVSERTQQLMHEVKEREQMQEAIIRASHLESLGVLAGGIAHDFNNLLNGLFGYLEMAQQVAAESPPVTECLDKALSVFARAKALTHQLLTFSRGGGPVRRQACLVTVVEEVTRFALRGSSAEPTFAFDDQPWSCEFDENQIAQVMDNLVINAVQSMPEGGMLTIGVLNHVQRTSTLTMSAGSYLKVSVTDCGRGISPDIIKRIFDPFFTTKETGSGLGLAICHSIIQKHGGFLDVESEVGRGTTFTFFLPACATETHVEETHEAEKSTVKLGNGRILVLDDEPILREVMDSLLRSLGHDPITFAEPEELLSFLDNQAAHGETIAAIFLDLTLPGRMGGKEVALLIREKFDTIPLVAISGFSEDQVMANPQAYGFTASLQKPFRRKELAALLG